MLKLFGLQNDRRKWIPPYCSVGFQLDFDSNKLHPLLLRPAIGMFPRYNSNNSLIHGRYA